jgi:hypothetical protein
MLMESMDRFYRGERAANHLQPKNTGRSLGPAGGSAIMGCDGEFAMSRRANLPGFL